MSPSMRTTEIALQTTALARARGESRLARDDFTPSGVDGITQRPASAFPLKRRKIAAQAFEIASSRRKMAPLSAATFSL